LVLNHKLTSKASFSKFATQDYVHQFSTVVTINPQQP